jgi:integrating conjugative element membrane protein (TIGR03747 family)
MRPDLAVTVANGLYALIFKTMGLHDMALRVADSAPLSIPDTVLRKTYLAFHDWIEVAMVGTQLFGARLATLTMALPVFLLAYAVATADGWVQRAIRRAGGGRESASLYHRAKHLQLLIVVFVAATSLLLPISMDLRWIWYPAALAIAVLARVQWSYYKKHL